MKKIYVSIILMACAGFLHGMEQTLPRVIKYGTHPQIILTKDRIYNRKNENAKIATVTVVGVFEQRQLQRPTFGEANRVGDTYQSPDNIVRIKNKNFESDSGDDTYHGYGEAMCIQKNGESFKIAEPWNHIRTKELKSSLFYVIEPHIFCIHSFEGGTNKYVYFGQLREYSSSNHEVIKEAQKDLALCYKNVLDRAHELFTQEKADKSIAFPPLSTTEGFPRDKAAETAVATLLHFIKESPHKDKYSSIEFVVNKRTDFVLYKALLDNVQDALK